MKIIIEVKSKNPFALTGFYKTIKCYILKKAREFNLEARIERK